MKARKAVYAASLDPITFGHINVVERMAPLYDEFVVVVAVDPRKSYTFTPEERVAMARLALLHIKNVRVDICVGQYVVKFADSIGAQVIIRGLRGWRDMEDEEVLSEENRQICPRIETVYVGCLKELRYVSSSLVKGHVGADPNWEEQAERSAPPAVVAKLKEKFILKRARRHWDALMVDLGQPKGSERIFLDLVARYGETHRAYHTLEHIVSMLDELREVCTLLSAPSDVNLAVWYHDVVYEPPSKDHPVIADNEARSAYRAELDLQKLGLTKNTIEHVKELIMATTHTEMAPDLDAQYLVDLDLAILGKSAKKFDRYDRGIANEYSWLPIQDFRRGRADVMEKFLNRKPLYLTKFFQDRYEATAKENLRKLVANLRG
ncbi:MAG: pantetheine-phosphate adenylyltransferase [Candidatus Paceibacterota bacterium]